MKIGDLDVRGLFVGGSSVSKAYLGADLVYSSAQPNNEIWYTTTDGNPIAETVLQYNYTFDASGTELTLQSNTYKGGKGVLSYSGDIARIEGEEDEDDYRGAYNNSNTLTSIEFPKTVSKLDFGTLVDCPYVETIVFNSLALDMGRSPLWVLNNGGTSAHLHSIVIQTTTAPTLTTTTLKCVAVQGTLYYPTGSDYSTWMTALESAQWKGKTVDDFDNLFYGMKLSPSSLELYQYQIDTNLYVQCSEDYGLTVDGDIKDYIVLPSGGGDADLTGGKTRFTISLASTPTENKTGTITVKSATYTKTVPLRFYNYDYVETDGYSYITTDFIPDVNVNYRIESIQHYLGTDGTWTKMWGYSQEQYKIFDVGIYYLTTNLVGYYGQSDWMSRSSIDIKRKCTVILTPEKFGVKETDEWISLGVSGNKLSGTVTKPMTLGCDWENESYTYPIWSDGETNTGPRASKMKIYDFKIYNNDTDELIAHYVPIQDGKMYNVVSGYVCDWNTKFQGEQGTIRQKDGGNAKVISGYDATETTE